MPLRPPISRGEGSSVFGLGARFSTGLVCESPLEAGQDLADAVSPDHHDEELDPVGEDRRAEGEAVSAIDRVRADGRDQEPEGQADQGVGRCARGRAR